jgi:2-methylisocitrate lyase-like PEP mutase family enzyme
MSVDRLTGFRALHRPGDPLLLPNAWDFTSAAALHEAGFAAIGTTSLGVAAAAGLPDGRAVTRTETLALARRLARLPCPVTVDIEGGFSDDPDEVARLAAELAGLGVAGINLEDGRADGTLTPVDRQRELIATVRARTPGLFLNARTDTYWLAGPQGPSLAETLDRVTAYRAAGADGVFVPGLADAGDVRAVVTGTDAPLNVLFLPGRHTVRGLAALGVARISTGSLLFRTAVRATVATALAVARDEPLALDAPPYAEINDLAVRY